MGAMPKASAARKLDPVREAAALAEINGDKAIPYAAAGLDEDFRALVRDRQRLDAKIKELEAAKSDITGAIQVLVEASGHRSVAVDDWRVTYSEGRKGSKKLEPRLLLEKGVPASVIAACTVEGAPGKPYIVVTEAKK